MHCPECHKRIDEERIFMLSSVPDEEIEFECPECGEQLTATVDYPMDDMPEIRII